MWRVAAASILLAGCFVDHRREIEEIGRQTQIELHSGAISQAKAHAERGLTLANQLGDPVIQWKFRLLRCEVLLTGLDAKAAEADLSTPVPQRPEFAALAARQKMLAGQASIIRRDLKTASKVLDEAHAEAEAAGDNETLVGVEMLQGVRLIQQQKWDPAEEWLNRALRRAEDNHLAYYEPGILVNLGMRRLSRRRFDEAVGYFQRASALSQSTAGELISVAQTNLGICYYRLGDFDRAIRILLDSVDRQQRSVPTFYLQMALGETGTAYQLKGDLRNAVKYLEMALNVARQIGRNAEAAIWAGNLSALYGDLKEWDKAELFNNQAIRIKTDAHLSSLAYNLLNTARIAVGRGHFEEGERLYHQAVSDSPENLGVLWEAYGALGQSALLQQHPEEASRQFESAVEMVEKARAGITSTEYKLPFLTRLIRFYQEYVDALIAQGDYERALAVADSSRAQVLAERFGSTSVQRLSPVAMRKIAQESGSTIVTYWLAPKHSHAWVVSAAQIHHIDLPPEGEIARAVGEYNDAIQRRLVDPLRTRIPAGETLFRTLVEPLKVWIPVGARIALVPDGALASLNFETLPVPGETPHFWIEDVSVSVAPSIGVLSHVQGKSAKGRGLLLIGDPDDADPNLPALTHASAEIDDVLRHFDPASRLVLRKKDAVPQSYHAADPSRFSVIHFTAHAIANNESPLDSAVLLSGGKLYAREVMDRPLNAELVTFSACRGAGSRNYGGEGLVGFAWAFLRAGARNVIAGLWDVNDQSTADLMDVTYREWERGKSPREALRTAKIALIRSSGNFKKPYYWGPFQVYTLAP